MEFTEEQKAEIEKIKAEAKEEGKKEGALEKEAELKKKHDAEMYQLRVNAKAEKEDAVAKAREDAKVLEEERQRKAYEEKYQKDYEELTQLRTEKKINSRKEKLVSAGVPVNFANDIRLINAEDDNVDEVINTIKTEWEQISPKGATTSTNVNGKQGGGDTDEFAQFRGLGVRRR